MQPVTDAPVAPAVGTQQRQQQHQTAAEGEKAGLKKKVIPPEKRVHVDGAKLRCGTVPWRDATAGSSSGSSNSTIEVLLIEGFNSPGVWSFPAGSLDPGEEASSCALRETEEECGVRGARGAFLGAFEPPRLGPSAAAVHRPSGGDGSKRRKKSSSSISYFWALEVHTVLAPPGQEQGEGFTAAFSERWHDPDSAWETDGWRTRRWFPAESQDTRALLKPTMLPVLDVFLALPPHPRADALYRCCPARVLGPLTASSAAMAMAPAHRLLLLGGADTAAAAEAAAAVARHCLALGYRLLPAGYSTAPTPTPPTPLSDAQRYAIVRAALWEADAVLCVVDGDDDERGGGGGGGGGGGYPGVGHMGAALALGAGRAVLMLRVVGGGGEPLRGHNGGGDAASLLSGCALMHTVVMDPRPQLEEAAWKQEVQAWVSRTCDMYG
jgi:8-oxo-dGTP pyrophosphatase MutT (NUDIX family)